MPSTIKCFSDDTKKFVKDKCTTPTGKNPVVGSQYVRISEETATIILDVEEERQKLKSDGAAIDTKIDEQTDDNHYRGLNVERELI